MVIRGLALALLIISIIAGLMLACGTGSSSSEDLADEEADDDDDDSDDDDADDDDTDDEVVATCEDAAYVITVYGECMFECTGADGEVLDCTPGCISEAAEPFFEVFGDEYECLEGVIESGTEIQLINCMINYCGICIQGCYQQFFSCDDNVWDCYNELAYCVSQTCAES